jgi:hypothetical protein
MIHHLDSNTLGAAMNNLLEHVVVVVEKDDNIFDLHPPNSAGNRMGCNLDPAYMQIRSSSFLLLPKTSNKQKLTND